MPLSPQANDFMSCPICFYHFSYQRKPVTLVCSHSICLSCLKVSGRQPASRGRWPSVINTFALVHRHCNVVRSTRRRSTRICQRMRRFWVWWPATTTMAASRPGRRSSRRTACPRRTRFITSTRSTTSKSSPRSSSRISQVSRSHAMLIELLTDQRLCPQTVSRGPCSES